MADRMSNRILARTAALKVLAPQRRGRQYDALTGQPADRDFLQNSRRLSQKRRLCNGSAPRKRRKTGRSSRSCVGFVKARDWMVVDAVSSEPVSGLNSLVTGKFTGNFAPREPSCADQTARKCLPIGPFSAFGSCPVQNRAGNFRTGIRELSGGDQGIHCP